MLSSFPANRLALNSLKAHTNSDNKNADNLEANNSRLESGLVQGANNPYLNEEKVYVTDYFLCINPLHSDERNQSKIERILNQKLGTEQNSLPFSEQIQRLIKYTCPLLQSLAF